MGTDKRALPWRGETLLGHAIATLARALAVAEADIWVSGDVARERALPDREPGGGPREGIRSALRRLPLDGGRLVVIPVDMPLLSEALLRRLATTAPEASALQFGGYELPLALRLDEAARAAAEAGEDRSLRGLAARLGAVALPVGEEEERSFLNVNDPAAYLVAAERTESASPLRSSQRR